MDDEKRDILSEEQQIEEAKTTLERVIGWINNCDSKTGIILALLGVVLTLVMTNEGLSALYKIIVKAVQTRTFSDVLYLILIILSGVCLAFGIYKLISVLLASIDSKKYKENNLETDSKIFFGSISKNESYQEYMDKFTKMNRKSYVNDVLSQIYINSLIAEKKFENYNTGVKHSIIGFCFFTVMFLIGIFVYL